MGGRGGGTGTAGGGGGGTALAVQYSAVSVLFSGEVDIQSH